MFQADGQPDQALADAGGLALHLGQAPMRSGARMRDDRLGIAQVGRDAQHARAVDHVEGIGAQGLGRVAVDVEGDHRPTQPGLLPHRQFVLRMRGQSGVVDARHRRLGLQPSSHRQRIGALRLHADAQCLHALEHDPGVERRQRHAGGAHHRSEDVDDQLRGSADRAGHDTALPVEVLGARMDHQVGAQFGRALQRRRAEAVVDRQQRAGGMGDVGQGGDVADIGQRVGRRLGEQQARLRPHRGAPFGDVGLRDEGRLHAELAELLAEQVERRAEDGARADDVVAGLQQAHAHHEDRRHAGGGADGGFGAFERGQALLEARDRRVGGARVGEAVLGAGEAAGAGGGIGLDEAAGQEQGFGMFAVLAGRQRGAQRERVAMQAFGQGSIGHVGGDVSQAEVSQAGLGSARREESSSVSSMRGRLPFMRVMASRSMSPVT